ncbi:MAG TPA: hypothetical protein VES67_19380 [Vicinamibacterales bacterium]|nr:hypothetical protein [Vicinamibacterales bacterium]
MARIDPDAAPAEKLTRVFVAHTLAAARSAEEVLTLKGIDYVVTVDDLGRTLFGSPRNVAVFEVAESQATYCAEILTKAGFGKGVISE